MHDPTPFDRGHQFRRRAPSFDIKIPLSSDNRSHHQQGLFYDTELDISANVPAVDRERNSARGASPASLRARSPSTEFTVARSFAEQKQMDLIESGEKSLGGKFRQLPCRTFIATGYCPYKDRCVYLHCPSVRTPYEVSFSTLLLYYLALYAFFTRNICKCCIF